MISSHIIAHVGMHLLHNPVVHAAIHNVVVGGLSAVVAFITPYIVPALIALGIVLAASLIIILTIEVAKWLMAEIAA